MFCPNCKCEYIRGVTQCADCGIALVDSLDASVDEPQDAQDVVPVWQGNDPTECAEMKGALEKAGIAVIDHGLTGYFIFPSMRPRMEICVSVADVEQAKKILMGLDAWNDPGELTPEERESLELPESDAAENDAPSDAEPELPQDWDEEEPVAEVWSGDKEEFAGTLAVCLREIGIASRKISDSGHWRLVVRPEQESRAKEIVREVVEASPPE